eukprot:Platyproteum_vivax@DN3395_c0_g1_i2.p1
MSNQFFKTKLCRAYRKGKCKLGDRCVWAHSEDELRPVVDLRKTSLCKAHVEGVCKDRNCKYAHGAQELRSTQDYWKTSLCIFWIEGTCRLGSKCRHAHGLDELHCRAYRRGDLEKRAEIRSRELNKIQRFLQRCSECSGGADVARMLRRATDLIPSGNDNSLWLDHKVFPTELSEPLRLLTSEQRSNFARMGTPQRRIVLHMLRDVTIPPRSQKQANGLVSNPTLSPIMSPMMSPKSSIMSPSFTSFSGDLESSVGSPRVLSPRPLSPLPVASVNGGVNIWSSNPDETELPNWGSKSEGYGSYSDAHNLGGGSYLSTTMMGKVHDPYSTHGIMSPLSQVTYPSMEHQSPYLQSVVHPLPRGCVSPLGSPICSPLGSPLMDQHYRLPSLYPDNYHLDELPQLSPLNHPMSPLSSMPVPPPGFEPYYKNALDEEEAPRKFPPRKLVEVNTEADQLSMDLLKQFSKRNVREDDATPHDQYDYWYSDRNMSSPTNETCVPESSGSLSMTSLQSSMSPPPLSPEGKKTSIL